MSSSVLPFLQAQCTRYGMSAILIFGTIGNLVIAILFSKRRQNACSMYLLCAAVMSTVNLLFILPVVIYSVDHPDPGSSFLVYCKFRYYLSHTWGQISRYLIVWACIDRFVLTNNAARFQMISRPQISQGIIGFMFIFWHVVAIHVFVLTTISNGRCGTSGLYSIVYPAYLAIVVCMIPPALMSIFGYLAYRNMKLLHARIRPIGNTPGENHGDIAINRRDRDLLVMVLTEAVVYVVTTFPYPFVYLEVSITGYMGVKKSTAYLQVESFLLAIVAILLYFNNAAPFYIYLAVSKAFRTEVKQLFTNLGRRLTGRIDAPVTLTGTQPRS